MQAGADHCDAVAGHRSFQHCAEKHLHRYVAEFDYRHNQRVALGVDDVTRAGRVLSRVSGKRLTYRTIN